MRVRRPTATAAVCTVAAFALMSPRAAADVEPPVEPPAQVEAETEDHTEARTEPSLSITPSPGRPGQSVVVSVSGGCTAPSATARSNVFTQNVHLSTGSAGVYTGTGTIRADARAGTHAVSVSCPGGATSTYSITVAGVTAPERGVRAGAGGSYGVDTVCLGAGIALVLAAGGYTAYRLRRRQY
ncbi:MULTISPECIES: hypothetical protein [Streptomyces]|uniref:hypothetical protein n=1 Tax=Streptomyces TaxID=1883 RepID=UPI001E2DC751|nr:MULTISPECIES: hypothetical protein [Streptomyces]UFQ13771.1 hypothetical protein J2N69_01350 [Streptomyces huasconensis]WCL83366.1 hypothetical protein PPN52_01335 [Streptomyces sp. JCM 35825]